MSKFTVIFGLALVFSSAAGLSANTCFVRSGWRAALIPANCLAASPQATKQKVIKNPAEYNAYMAIVAESESAGKISKAEAFTNSYPNSVVVSDVYWMEVPAYYQIGESDLAVEAARKVLLSDPDHLGSLTFLSYLFPFRFRAGNTPSAADLSRAETDARHGLDVLMQDQKPSDIPTEQFERQVRASRAAFHRALGFVAQQRKDHPTAIASYKSATEDDQSDYFIFYQLGAEYLRSTPPDYDRGVWDISRAVALARTSKSPAGDQIYQYLKSVYTKLHGDDVGLEDTIAQALDTVDPPQSFKVTNSPGGPAVAHGPSPEVEKKPSSPLPACQEGALREYQVIDLLDGGLIPVARVIQIVRQRGVCFDLSPGLITMLKDKGADNELLDAIRKGGPGKS